ncbi:MAG: peptidase M2 family protein, partial [Gammaproteobacteria bacterium]|nr:peptidase M2 family protein [Gammaproteobacteria bacterium]
MRHIVGPVASLLLVLLLSACAQKAAEGTTPAVPTETADEFVARANAELAELNKETAAAEWVRATYITEDTATIAAAAKEKFAAWHSGMVQQAKQYDGQELSAETRRAIDLLKLGTSLPTPDDAAKRKELTMIATELKGMYGAGKYCSNDNDCKSLPELEDVLANNRDYDELKDAWTGWRTISPPMREKYRRYVELVNEGANELGYGDLGEMWRAGFDMNPTEFQQETGRLWEQVKPLYDELHCHVRARLGEVYGADKVPQNGPIPAHLLGNMWSQG